MLNVSIGTWLKHIYSWVEASSDQSKIQNPIKKLLIRIDERPSELRNASETHGRWEPDRKSKRKFRILCVNNGQHRGAQGGPRRAPINDIRGRARARRTWHTRIGPIHLAPLHNPLAISCRCWCSFFALCHTYTRSGASAEPPGPLVMWLPGEHSVPSVLLSCFACPMHREGYAFEIWWKLRRIRMKRVFLTARSDFFRLMMEPSKGKTEKIYDYETNLLLKKYWNVFFNEVLNI